MSKRYFAALAVFAFSMASMSAHADDNPLSGLLGALGKLGNAVAKPGDQPTSAGANNGGSDADEIMRQLSTQDISLGCAVRSQITGTVDKYKMGRYAEVASAALVNAQGVAACALKGGGIASLDDKSLVGQLLAMSAVANHKAGLDFPEITIRAQNALTLLRLDPGANKDMITQVETSGVLPERGPVSGSNAAARMSAFDLATKYQKNTLAFTHDYSGKTLQVDGIVKSIAGDERQALLVLNGIPKSLDEQAWRDVVQCRITDSGALNDAMAVEKGRKVSVRGLYMKKQLDMGPTLYDCKIIR